MEEMTRQEGGLIAIISHSQVLIAILPRRPSPLSSLPLSLFFSLHCPSLIAPHRHVSSSPWPTLPTLIDGTSSPLPLYLPSSPGPPSSRRTSPISLIVLATSSCSLIAHALFLSPHRRGVITQVP
ncbi:hypothetical protein IGI04_007117 [Brassica rapa subsp. trilocularis]|uniref:Uncharacterized protein n=1 Tax=Brassica rapa subsp. trilocularis TaxID=1813537 RepID=A0ABQ7NIU1_BRACM|nr:hypothetical protein IGI04_007117 [Brassica rapa subsp. trilocularis]